MKQPGFSDIRERAAKLTRMRLLLAAFALIFLYGGGAMAALAPQYDRWVELQTVMADQSIPKKLWEHGPVDRIEAKPGGIYRVWARRCYVDVTIKTESNRSETPGSQPISGVTIGEAHCS